MKGSIKWFKICFTTYMYIASVPCSNNAELALLEFDFQIHSRNLWQPKNQKKKTVWCRVELIRTIYFGGD